MASGLLSIGLVVTAPVAAQPWEIAGVELSVELAAGETIHFAEIIIDDSTTPEGDTRFFVHIAGRGIACGTEYVVASSGEGAARHAYRFDLELWQLGANRITLSALVVADTGALRIATAERSFELAANEALFSTFGRRRELATVAGRLVETTVIRRLSPWVENCRATFCKDSDRDGLLDLLDLWEQLATAALQPWLLLDPDDGFHSDLNGALADLVRTTPQYRDGEPIGISIQHTAAFSRDYGPEVLGDAHNGDGEDFRVQLGVERSRRSWCSSRPMATPTSGVCSC